MTKSSVLYFAETPVPRHRNIVPHDLRSVQVQSGLSYRQLSSYRKSIHQFLQTTYYQFDLNYLKPSLKPYPLGTTPPNLPGCIDGIVYNVKQHQFIIQDDTPLQQDWHRVMCKLCKTWHDANIPIKGYIVVRDFNHDDYCVDHCEYAFVYDPYAKLVVTLMREQMDHVRQWPNHIREMLQCLQSPFITTTP